MIQHLHISGAEKARDAMVILLGASAWFEMEPLPDDLYAVIVKDEHAHFIEHLTVQVKGLGELLQEIYDDAEEHGKVSDPDHEVGDLQDALRIAWETLGEKGCRHVHERFMAEVSDRVAQEKEC